MRNKPSIPGFTGKRLTPGEKARIEAYDAAQASKPQPPKIAPDLDFETDDEGALFAEAVGRATGSQDGSFGIHVLQLAGAVLTEGRVTAEGINLAGAAMVGMKPRDEVEGMLLAQMVACHDVAMRRLAVVHVDGQTVGGADTNINQAVKLMRTFAVQVEALSRYRKGGQQKVTVEHVHVYPGGQAVVGTINQPGAARGVGDAGRNQGSTGYHGQEAGPAVPIRLADGQEMWCEMQADGAALYATGHAER